MVTTMTSATTEPTDRSMPPLIMTSNAPRAAMATMVLSWTSTWILPRLKKVPRPPLNPTSSIKMPSTTSKPSTGPDGMNEA